MTDTSELYARGLVRRKRMFGEAEVDKRMAASQVQDVLLLVAMYCGIPAAIETHRIAAEIFAKDVPPATNS